MKQKKSMKSWKKGKRLMVILLVILFSVALLTGIQSDFIGNLSSENGSEENKIENKTNMDELKASKYTGEKFEQLKIGESKNDIDEKLKKGEYLGKTKSGLEVYTYKEIKQSTYQLYFKNDKLQEVSVILNN